MTAMGADPSLIANARGLAKKLLRKGLPERWLHTQGVASRAAELAVTVPAADRPVLIAAAWLHDIGYAPAIQDTGFHPLDGGLYLRREGWDDRLAALVAHHSGARFVPAERGYDSMMTEFDFEDGPVRRVDLRRPDGRSARAADDVPYRIVEAITRHGPDSPNARSRVDRVALPVGGRGSGRTAAGTGSIPDHRPVTPTATHTDRRRMADDVSDR